MWKRQKRILSTICMAVCACAAFGLVWHRVAFGLDVTDESFWIAEPFLTVKGSVPFASQWNQTPLTSLLIAPLVWLYTMITGGTEGIVLYMMRAAVVYRAVVSVTVWRLLRKPWGDSISAAFSVALFCCDMGHSKGLNYNLLSVYLLALAGSFIFRALGESNERRSARMYFFAGIVMALCALAHVTQVVNCVFFAVLLLPLERRKYGRAPLWGFYMLGGAAIALVTVTGLEIAGKGGVFSGLALVLRENNYFKIPHMTPREQLLRSAGDLRFYGRLWLLAFALLFAAAFFVLAALFRNVRGHLGKCCVLAHVGASCALLLVCAWRRINGDFPTFVIFLAAPLLLLAIESQSRRVAWELLACYWLPCLFSWLLAAVASHSPANYRYYVMTAGAISSILLGHRAICGQFGHADVDARKWSRFIIKELPLCVSLCFSLVFLVTAYAGVYRDDPIPRLTYRVETGVYKGMRTSYERGKSVEALERSIRALTSAGESVLISDLFPMGYLMTDASFCTPTTWDPCHYRYGFQDMALFEAYFEREGKSPDKILFINSEDNPLSIDDPENRFAAYVKAGYICTDRVGEGLFSMRVYTKRA